MITSRNIEESAEESKSLTKLLDVVLGKLGRRQSLDEHLRYLQSEWLTTEQDLRACMQDDKTWRDLQLPSRLKLALKEECQRSEAPRTSVVSSNIPAPIAAETLAASDAFLNVMETLEDESTKEPETNVEYVEHKADDGEEDDEFFFRDQVNQKWVKSYSPEHKCPYFFNEITEETLWELPEGVKAFREDEWSGKAEAQASGTEAEAEAGAEPEGEVDGEDIEKYEEEYEYGEVEDRYGEEDDVEEEEDEEETRRAARARQAAREAIEEAQAIKAVAQAKAAERAAKKKIQAEATTAIVRDEAKVAETEELEAASLESVANPDGLSVTSSDLTGLERVSWVEGIPLPPPTAYIQPPQNMSQAPPSAPMLPPELMGKGVHSAEPLSVNSTPLGSPNAPPTAVAVPVGKRDTLDSEDEEDLSDYDDDEEVYGDVEVDLEMLQLLTDMGFKEDVAASSLQRHNNDLELATNSCLQHEEREAKESRPSSAHSTSTRSTGSTRSSGSNSSARRVMNSSEYMRALERIDTSGETAAPRPFSASRKGGGGSTVRRLGSSISKMFSAARKSRNQREDMYKTVVETGTD